MRRGIVTQTILDAGAVDSCAVSCPGRLALCADVFRRIDDFAVAQDFEVHMRPGGSARVPHTGDHITLGHTVTDLDVVLLVDRSA